MEEEFGDDHTGEGIVPRIGGEVPEGFQDQAGALPKTEYSGQPDINNRARSRLTKGGNNRGTKGARTKSRDAQLTKDSVNQPNTPSQTRYPHNHVTESTSGHIHEVDDTPGHERLNWEHQTGTKIEMAPDGSMTTVIERDAYTIIAGDDNVVIRGTVNIIIESDASIRVQGDCDMQVDGDHNVLVQGDQNIEVQGNRTLRVHGDDQNTTTGTRLRQTRGSVTELNLSNYLERTVGTHTEEYGGDWKVTTQGSSIILSEGPLEASFFGGFLNMNGKNATGTVGAGKIETKNYFGDDWTGDNVFLTADLHARGDVHVTGTVNAPTFEGTAKKSDFALTAGSAPTGASSPTTPGPVAPTSGSAGPATTETATDVTNTSNEFIVNIDRTELSNFNKRPLNTGEVTSRARNKSLMTDSKWLQDTVNSGAAKSSIGGGSAPATKRTAAANTVKTGTNRIGTKAVDKTFTGKIGNNLRILSIPEQFKITTPERGTRLSPRYRVSHLLAGDSEGGQFIDQVGLTKQQIAENMQLLSFNVLELLRNKYKDTFNISEGLYNLLPNEQLDSDSINVEFAQGLAVGIQFPDHPNSYYFEVAGWIQENLVFDKLILSYIDYDPSGVNEPTLVISIKNGVNAKTISTEFNHVSVGSGLSDLSE